MYLLLALLALHGVWGTPVDSPDAKATATKNEERSARFFSEYLDLFNWDSNNKDRLTKLEDRQRAMYEYIKCGADNKCKNLLKKLEDLFNDDSDDEVIPFTKPEMKPTPEPEVEPEEEPTPKPTPKPTKPTKPTSKPTKPTKPNKPTKPIKPKGSENTENSVNEVTDAPEVADITETPVTETP